MNRPAEGLVVRTGSLVVAAGFLWVTLNVLVAPKYGVVRWPRVGVPVAAAVVLVVLVLAVVASRGLVRRLEERPWLRRVLLLVALLAMFAVQVRLGYSIRFNPGWDAGFLETQTRGIVDGTIPVESVAATLAAYPNNLFLASLMTRFWEQWLGAGHTDGDLGLVLVNAAVLCASVVFVYLAARRLGGPATAYVASLFCVVFVGVSPWIGVVYSDTVGMLPIAVLAYLAVLLRDVTGWARPLLWLAVGVVGALGYAIKPTVVFAVLALVAVTVLTTAWRTWSSRDALLRVGAVLGLGVGAVIGLQATTLTIDAAELSPPPGQTGAAFPVSHFLMMGAAEKPGPYNPYYGAYRDEDALATLAVPIGEERERHGFEEYKARVSAMGPVGYARFLNDKATWTMGDGTFFMYGEGSMAAVPTPFAHGSATDRQVQSFLGLHGDRFWMVADTWQAFWLVVLLLMAAPLVLRDRDLDSLPAAAMRAGLLGLVLFVLFFEGRSRYLYLYLPFFLLLASTAVVAIARRVRPEREAQRDAETDAEVAPAG
ncbi:glycosyltransferase family 39 protein [Nocardioides KLBMP 9356]|uniref:Glycosyltransferase family 39 protein n=1 Tax=Nocardioides potassii TaxID=2911371 RepID=A0ABS9HDI6_9ACTN|nr:glycosyltransferase family 39 protein [Nocardioides potassii]MCF6378549.1 glycosyltransferase family 39 protein [Nocardioides potassii]